MENYANMETPLTAATEFTNIDLEGVVVESEAIEDCTVPQNDAALENVENADLFQDGGGVVAVEGVDGMDGVVGEGVDGEVTEGLVVEAGDGLDGVEGEGLDRIADDGVDEAGEAVETNETETPVEESVEAAVTEEEVDKDEVDKEAIVTPVDETGLADDEAEIAPPATVLLPVESVDVNAVEEEIMMPVVRLKKCSIMQEEYLDEKAMSIDDMIAMKTEVLEDAIDVKTLPKRRGRKPNVDKLKKEIEIDEVYEPSRTRTRKSGVATPPIKTESVKKPPGRPPKVANDSEKSCRVCLGTESLVSLFKLEENEKIAAKVMTICSSVKIVEKDFLPQFICRTCLESLHVALNFKALCETTDRDLRSKLKRSENKVRRPTEFVMIDCDDLSEESVDDFKAKDDDEYHLSNPSAPSEPESDSDSDFSTSNKRKPRRSGRKRKGPTRRKSIPVAPPSSAGPAKRRGRKPRGEKPAKTVELSSDEENELDQPPKKRRSRQKSEKLDDEDSSAAKAKRNEPQMCIYCNQEFAGSVALREHKKTHLGEKPLTCNICGKAFKLQGSFRAHLQKHAEEKDNLSCSKCDKHFSNKTEHRRHMIEEHGEPVATFVCDKCKRAFTTAARLERHKEHKCPGFEPQPGRKPKQDTDSFSVGRDLFKCVAPMTSTYWSDSFSE